MSREHCSAITHEQRCKRIFKENPEEVPARQGAVGAGKRTGPVRRGLRKLRRQRSGLTDTGNLCAELVNKGMSVKEYAGLTDRQIFHLYFRPRDKYGRLTET